jgi:signal transduction histidine kinase
VVYADRNRLRHALLNLLRNAAQATTPTDCLRVRTRREGTVARIEVEDTGEGMAPETMNRIFTPFFTTKGTSGMGLGLRLALATIEAHGGALDFTSVLGQGSVFRVSLPVVA